MDCQSRWKPRPRPFRFGLVQGLLSLILLAVFLAIGWTESWILAAWTTLVLACFMMMLGSRASSWGCFGVIVGTFGFALFAESVLKHPPQVICARNLRCIAAALMSYEAQHGCFPPAFLADARGRPRHSWRVLILPHLGAQQIYDQYRFDEPWDGPHNRQLTALMPDVFRCPSSDLKSLSTNYVAVVGPNTIWPGARSTRLADVPDGVNSTLLLVETTEEIPWMEPRDLELGKFPPQINPPGGGGIASHHPPPSRFPRREPAGAWVAFADGRVRFLPNDVPAEILAALLTKSGHEPLPEGFDENTHSR